ncbi:MAG: dihydroorotate dehydrogenase electron transfer subunit [Streptosporangiaceae bacterium]
MAAPRQVRGQVLTLRRVGAYRAMTVVAPGVPIEFRPGHFVSIAVGGAGTSMMLRRAFSIHEADPSGMYGGTIEFVFAVCGPGTSWLATRRPGDTLDVVGPLGRPFALPREPVHCVLVGGGYGSAPLFPLAEMLRGRGCRVDFVLGARTADRVFGERRAARTSDSATLTTEDGTLGVAGRVIDVLPRVLVDTEADAVYACGPMPMLRAVAAIASDRGLPSQVAVEESMACGFGVCMTCVLPVVGRDSVTRMVRSCVEGPVFRGDRVRWDRIGTIPEDAIGAGGARP